MSIRGSVIRGMVLAVFALGLPVGARAGVIVVDPGGGGGTAQLQAALAAAVDGDIVLLRDGAYSLPVGQKYLINGKGIVVTRDSGTQNFVLSPLLVTNVPAGRTVVLRDLIVQPQFPSVADSNAAVSVANCAGSVMLENCSLRGGKGAHPADFSFELYHDAGAGLRAANCASVIASRCSLTGGAGSDYQLGPGLFYWSKAGAEGVQAVASRVVLDHCTLQAGNNGNGNPDGFGFLVAAAGLSASQASLVHCAGSSATGGNTSLFNNAGLVEYSGNGATVLDAGSHLQQRNSTFVAGVSVGAQDLDGTSIDAPPGTVMVLPAPARELVVSSPVREGQAGTLTFTGQPGDIVTLLAAFNGGWLSMPGHQGVLQLDASGTFVTIALGTVGGGGQLAIPFVAPNLAPGMLGITLLMQAAVKSTDGVTLEATTSMVWLDSSL